MADSPLSSSFQSSSPLYTFGIPWPDLNAGISYTDVIKPIDSNKTLIDFYSSKYKSSAPFLGWMQRIKNGQISVDGDVVTDPDYVLRVGCEAVYCRLPWREPDVPYSLEVLYEDEDMVAINKPSALQVLPGGQFQQRTVLKQLQWNTWGQNSCCPGNCGAQGGHPAPVHRLGRGTSGILLCAKTIHAKTWLAAYFAQGTLAVGDGRKSEPGDNKERKILKFYRALVTGLVEKDEVEIQSGRPHQIRIHLAFIGYPLFGDPLYDVGGLPKVNEAVVDDSFAEDGGYNKPTRPVPGDCGYYLHAHRVIFCHPSTNEVVKITAPLPSILRTRKELAEDTFLNAADRKYC